MEKKKCIKTPRLVDLIPDQEKSSEVLNRLYKGDPILGDYCIFTDMLQTFVNASLEGEMDHTP